MTLEHFQRKTDQPDFEGWRIEWTESADGPESRETSIALLAWYAAEYDDDATVVEQYDDVETVVA
jgi:hypothetical protein